MIRSKVVAGEPLDIDGRQLTIIGRLWQIDFPYGRTIWLRPTAVAHQSATDKHTYPIYDPTRLMQVGLLLTGLIVGVLRWGGRRS